MTINMRVICSIAVIASGFLSGTALCQGPPPPQPPPAPPAPTGLVEREELTGDWGGTRTRWKDKGVTVDSSLTQFYQGVASGGTNTSSEYNGTAQTKLEFDFGKLAGWQWWSAEIKGEWRLADRS
jgi:carbohydrate-selective porin OprB